MDILEVTYDIGEGAFRPIIASVKAHLTPKKGTDELSPPTLTDMKEFADSIVECPQAYQEVTRERISWHYAAYYAIDLGVLPDDLDDLDALGEAGPDGLMAVRDKLQDERYSVPATPGTTRTYSFVFTGRHVNFPSMDIPMLVRMIGDSGQHSDSLYLLKSWFEGFNKEGPDGMRRKMDDIRALNKGQIPEFDAFLASLPATTEGFEERIRAEEMRYTSIMLDGSINAIRFYWDFIGKPIEAAGYLPTGMTVKGSYFEMTIPEAAREMITRYPTVPKKEIIRQILSPLEGQDTMVN
ncbi:MAG: hypothetical protein HY518_00910 [Candidatus Aenigmarchaeota archaeon]|nr:hypothetical protein [Candidatus Aenigmarchaeota archaeon]